MNEHIRVLVLGMVELNEKDEGKMVRVINFWTKLMVSQILGVKSKIIKIYIFYFIL